MNLFKKQEHQQNTLYESKKGYVVHCSCCNVFHIAYGTVSFDQTENSLLSLMSVLNYYYQQYHGQIHPECRCIQVVTPFKGFRLMFSTKELREFADILSEAYLVFETERIINTEN